MAFAAVEAARRAWHRVPPGVIAERLEAALLLVLGVATAGGLGMLAGGGSPRAQLHFVYAMVVLGALPIAAAFSREGSPRVRGVASLVGALLGLVVVARLFSTG